MVWGAVLGLNLSLYFQKFREASQGAVGGSFGGEGYRIRQ
jgi:hypothetical protein